MTGRLRIICLTFGLASASTAWSWPPDTIGLFSAQDCASCRLSIAPGESKLFYAVLMRDGHAETSVVSFRIGAVPQGWTWEVSAGPGMTLVGDPFGSGVAVDLPYPSPPGHCLTLFSVRLTATSAQQEVALDVGSNLANSIGCPFTFTLGNDEGLLYCAETSSLYVNSERDCSTGVAQVRWAAVKILYH